jgi:hypothetical protein
MNIQTIPQDDDVYGMLCRADTVGASLDVGEAPFFFFSTEAFVAAVGLGDSARPGRSSLVP